MSRGNLCPKGAEAETRPRLPLVPTDGLHHEGKDGWRPSSASKWAA